MHVPPALCALGRAGAVSSVPPPALAARPSHNLPPSRRWGDRGYGGTLGSPEVPAAAVTKYHGDKTNRSFLAPSSRGQKSKLKGPRMLGSFRGRSIPRLSPPASGDSGIRRPLSPRALPCVSVSSRGRLLRGHSPSRLRGPPSLGCVCKDLISSAGHGLRPHGFGFQQLFLGSTWPSL